MRKKIRQVKTRNENLIYYHRDSTKAKPVLAQLKALDKKLDINWDKQDEIKRDIYTIRRLAPLKINMRRRDPLTMNVRTDIQKRHGYGLLFFRWTYGDGIQMGTTVKFRYTLTVKDRKGVSIFGWRVSQFGKKVDGTPTNKNLERWIRAYAKSLESGGVNFHISKKLNEIPYPNEAFIKDQKTGKIVAKWKAATFQGW